MGSIARWNAAIRGTAVVALTGVGLLAGCRVDTAVSPAVHSSSKASANIAQSCYYDNTFGWNCTVENYYQVPVDIGYWVTTDNNAYLVDCTNCGGGGADPGPVVSRTDTPIGYYDPTDKALSDSLKRTSAVGCYETSGLQMPANGDVNWDASSFGLYLDTYAGTYAPHSCARAVRKALCFANLKGACDDYQHPYCAKYYGAFLYNAGFTETWTGSGLSANGYPTTPPGYSPQEGDIVVFWYEGAGHIAGYDGYQWVSDYKQDDIQPDPISVPNRPYTIYRHP